MKKIAYILIFVIFFIIGCEVELTDTELPYNKQLVVSSYIRQGNDSVQVRVTKTLPPLENYSLEKAKIEDAEVIIDQNGKEYKCKYIENGLYRTFIPGDVQEGDIYDLEVKWNNKIVTSSTFIPGKVEITGFDYTINNDDYFSRELTGYVTFKPNRREVYSSNNDPWQHLDVYYDLEKDIKKHDQVNSDNELKLKFYNTYIDRNEDPEKVLESLKVAIGGYDEAVYDYLAHRNEYNDDFLFSTAGTNIKWNVKGDGIGIFTGINYTTKDVEIEE